MLAVIPFVLFADITRAAEGQVKLEIVPQVPHSGGVRSVAFSPDGARVLSGGADWHVAPVLRSLGAHRFGLGIRQRPEP